MERAFYLELAASGLRMPIAADLVLHEQADPEAILLDGARLGCVLELTARRYGSPLALPHMDLELEKAALLGRLGVPEAEMPSFHFTSVPTEARAVLQAQRGMPFPPRLRAHLDSIRYIATQTDLVPVGMAIGPFSLMTKLVADPITPIALAGMGMTAAEDADIALVEEVLELSVRMVLTTIAAQVQAGARAIFLAEPAANRVYLSPNQIADGADIFERYVMAYNRQIRAYLGEQDVDLYFHCCGELTDEMVRQFGTLDPAILSLGSSRVLWEDAPLLPKDVVLYGNLPSKQFYSDGLITAGDVARRGETLVRKMRDAGHPFILGTECDVLSVPGCEEPIRQKVAALHGCRGGHAPILSN
jgi:uroporphyrinogen-III decarboxylase